VDQLLPAMMVVDYPLSSKQPTKQSINQPINQSINQSIYIYITENNYAVQFIHQSSHLNWLNIPWLSNLEPLATKNISTTYYNLVTTLYCS
jgi:hypothetical protein